MRKRNSFCQRLIRKLPQDEPEGKLTEVRQGVKRKNQASVS
jgi:uncharacterized protein YbaA (DUF1428 family)